MRIPIRRLLVFAVVGVLFVVAGLVGLFWWMFVGTGSGRNKAALAHLRDVGYLPAAATDVFISDTHDGFHGDGETLLAFRCPRTCLDLMKERVARDYAPQVDARRIRGWSSYTDAGPAEIRRTIEWMVSNDEWRSRVPDTSAPEMLFLCGDPAPGPNAYCGNLFVLDYAAGRFWYMNIQT